MWYIIQYNAKAAVLQNVSYRVTAAHLIWIITNQIWANISYKSNSDSINYFYFFPKINNWTNGSSIWTNLIKLATTTG